MDYAVIDMMIQEATRGFRHNLDESLSQVHGKLQNALTSEHRSAYDGSDYDTYPQVHHVFGDKNGGHVVYRQGDSHYRAPYKMDNGGYSVGTPESVQLAYVPENQTVSEAMRELVVRRMEDSHNAVEIMERYISTTERKSIPEEDFAGKGRSYPIKKPEDVRAALDSIGRAGNGNHSPEELKSRILAIAKRKGFAIPKSDKEAKESYLEHQLYEETTVFQESAVDSKGNALIKLISSGTGSMGHYSSSVLKEAAKNRVFPAGTRMFLDHQTAEERAKRPEGEVGKWAATTTKDAEYMENGPDGEGLYAHANVYGDHAQFVKERAKDIGVSVRAGVTTTGKMVDGVPEVKEMKYGLSADFVTRAGRGGKVVEMYESFRSTQKAGINKGDEMTDQEKQEFAKLSTRLDRLTEDNNRLRATQIIGEAFNGSGLNARAQTRITKELTASVPVTAEGALDVTKLQESTKAAIKDELEYLQESGARVSPFLIKANGGQQGAAPSDADQTKLLEESEKTLSSSINHMLGRKEKTA